MVNGRVCTGFSKPYVAVYGAAAGAVTYTNGMVLARGVNVSIDPDDSEDNEFHADNQLAESAGGTFTGGSITLTVDGLKDAAEKLVFGNDAAGTDGWTKWGGRTKPPYVGVGYITRYMEEGVESFVPTIIRKVKMNLPSSDAATQEEEIEFQTQELSGTIFRDDTTTADWKWTGAGQTTEAAAEAKIKTALGITEPEPDPEGT